MSKKQKPLTFSLIIPVYNEEDYLGACLDSVAAQTVAPAEVIVVDNNSTDETVKIAKGYDFVRVIREKRQHQAFAQHTGFGLARGDIVGRVDADTVLPANWIERNLKAFSADPEMIACSGSGFAYDVVLKRLGELIFRFYFALSARFAGHRLMWGSNCAFRRSAWELIKDDLLLRGDIWEDYDLAFCLAEHGRVKSIRNPVGVSYRAIHRQPRQQLSYHLRSIRTFYLRKGVSAAFLLGICWSSVVLIGPIILFDYYLLRPAINAAPLKLLLSRIAAGG